MSSDGELLGAYVTQGSEAAFRTLVARHVSLVYATALRQLGDAGLAEEVTQNVFLTLAKKSPGLGDVETLAGWLHRATILETKQRIRAELRRRRREETAAAVAAAEREGASPLEAMLPLLDEGLLGLKEADRIVLILRFLEDRSLRDVGTALGVDEDAARKRVARALERLSKFFHQRGVILPVGVTCTAFLTGSVQAAPAGLAAAASQTALAVGGKTAGLKFWFYLMALSKTQTIVISVLLVSAPLLWQRQAQAKLDTALAEAEARLLQATQRAAGTEQELATLQASFTETQAETQKHQTRLALLNAQQSGQAPRPVYGWDDSSPVLRVPKAALKALPVGGIGNRSGELSEPIKEVLQMTSDEIARVQALVSRFRTDFLNLSARSMQVVTPTKDELGSRPPEEVRAFAFGSVEKGFKDLRSSLFVDLQNVLGAERFEVFRRSLNDWIPVDDKAYRGVSSEAGIYVEPHREHYARPKPGEPAMPWGLSATNGSSVMSIVSEAEIPAPLRPHLQDWIDLMAGHEQEGK